MIYVSFSTHAQRKCTALKIFLNYSIALHVLYMINIFQILRKMRFTMFVLVILLGVTAVGSAPSTRRSSTTHLMKRLLVQLLTRVGDSSDESEGSGLGYGVRIYYLIFNLAEGNLSVILFMGGGGSDIPGPRSYLGVSMSGPRSLLGIGRYVWGWVCPGEEVTHTPDIGLGVSMSRRGGYSPPFRPDI